MKYFHLSSCLSMAVLTSLLTVSAFGEAQLLAEHNSPRQPTYLRPTAGVTELPFSFSSSETNIFGPGLQTATLLDGVIRDGETRADFVATRDNSADFDLAASFLQDDLLGLMFFSVPSADSAGFNVLNLSDQSIVPVPGAPPLRDAMIDSIVLNLTDISFSPAALPDGGTGTEVAVTVSVQVFGIVPEPAGLATCVMGFAVSMLRIRRNRAIV